MPRRLAIVYAVENRRCQDQSLWELTRRPRPHPRRRKKGAVPGAGGAGRGGRNPIKMIWFREMRLLLAVALSLLLSAQGFSISGSCGKPVVLRRQPSLSCEGNTFSRGFAVGGGSLVAPARRSRMASRSRLSMLGGGDQVKQVLRKYGLAALGTHFVGWSICMTGVISFLGAVGPENIISILPEGIQQHIDPTKAMGVVKFQIALAATEAIGPVRLALTLTVTPTVSKTMRQYKTSRDLETMAIRFARNVARNVARTVKSQGAELVESVKDGGLEKLVEEFVPPLSVPITKEGKEKGMEGGEGSKEPEGSAPSLKSGSGTGPVLSSAPKGEAPAAGASTTLKR